MRGTDTTPGAGVHETEPIAFRRQTAGQDIAWRIIPQVTVKGLYEWEHWNRHDREVESTNEHTFGGVVDVRPWNWVLARFYYAHSVKTIHAGGYEPLGGNAVTLPQFRKFDEADRTRDKGDAAASRITPLETLTLSGSFFVQDGQLLQLRLRTAGGPGLGLVGGCLLGAHGAAEPLRRIRP